MFERIKANLNIKQEHQQINKNIKVEQNIKNSINPESENLQQKEKRLQNVKKVTQSCGDIFSIDLSYTLGKAFRLVTEEYITEPYLELVQDFD